MRLRELVLTFAAALLVLSVVTLAAPVWAEEGEAAAQPQTPAAPDNRPPIGRCFRTNPLPSRREGSRTQSRRR